MPRSVVFCVIAVAAMLFGGNAHAQCVDLGPYFNLTGGRSLLYLDYDEDGAGGLIADEIYFHYIHDLGGGLKAEIDFFPPTWGPRGVTLWQENPDGHYHVLDYNFGDQDLDITLPPPGPVDGCMVEGETIGIEWLEFDNSGLDGFIEFDLTLMEVGTSCPTPAGDFDDCVLMMADQVKDGSYLGRQYWVLARDVGLVLSMMLEWQGPAAGLVPEDMELLVEVLGGSP